MEQRALSVSYFGDYVHLSFGNVDAKLAALLDIPHKGHGGFFGFVSNFPSVSTCFLASILSNPVVDIITVLSTL